VYYSEYNFHFKIGEVIDDNSKENNERVIPIIDEKRIKMLKISNPNQ